jgi:hypothetical protein
LASDEESAHKSKIYGIFNHPIRGKIVGILAERGPLTYTDLRAEMKLGVGTLYYHLSILGDLVSQGRDKRYFLSELGMASNRFLTSGSSVVKSTKTEDSPFAALLTFSSGLPLIRVVNDRAAWHLLWATAIVLGGGVASAFAGLSSRLFFFIEGSPNFLVSFGTFVFGWISLFTILEIGTRVGFKSKGGDLSLLAGTALSYAPMTLFSLLWLGDVSFGLGITSIMDGWISRIIFFILQAWSLLILVSVIKISKNVQTSRAILLVLAIAYINATLLLVGTV